MKLKSNEVRGGDGATARGVKRERDLVDSAVRGSGRAERRGSKLKKKDSKLHEASSESWRKDVELQNKESEL